MTSTEVKKVVANVLTDDVFAQQFESNRDQALAQFDLSNEEIDALNTIDFTQISTTDIQLSRDFDHAPIRIGSAYIN